MAENTELGPRIITIMRDDEREIYFSLSHDEHVRIKAGERIETAAGLAFHFHEQTAQVDGRDLRIIVATPTPKPAHDARAAYRTLQAEHAYLAAVLWRPGIPEEARVAFTRYADAWGKYAGSVSELWEAKANVRARRVAESKVMPGIVASELARMKAKKAHAGSDKAIAKAGALELWKERNAGEHPKLRTVEQFATEVMRRWPVLTSAKVICGWSARWTKEVKGGKNPVC